MRALAAAVLGIYGNSKMEAMYPVYAIDADGQKPDGARRYTIHFSQDQLPTASISPFSLGHGHAVRVQCGFRKAE